MATRKRKPKPIASSPYESIWVETHENSFWRRKRGTVKPAVLNKSLRGNASHSKIVGPAASRLRAKLQPFFSKMVLGRITARIFGLFIKTFNQKRKLDFSLFNEFEIQEKYPLDRILRQYSVIEKDSEIIVTIPINSDTLRTVSKLVTEYYFELILLHGDPSKPKSFRIDTTDSYRYPFIKNPKESVCTLSIILPSTNAPWMVFLKLNCREGKEAAAHAKHYPMKVVAVG